VQWPKLKPPEHPDGFVLFGVSRPDAVIGVTRIAVLMSHCYGAQPLAVHVALGEEPTWEGCVDLEGERLLERARDEARALGYPLRTYSEFAASAAAGIRQAAEKCRPHVVIVGRSYGCGAPGFGRTADAVGDGETWPLMVIRIDGWDRFRGVLVPLADRSDLARLQPILRMLDEVCRLPVRMALLAEHTASDAELERGNAELVAAAGELGLGGRITCHRMERAGTAVSILQPTAGQDLIVLHSADRGSSPPGISAQLAEDLARRADLPLILVRGDLRPGG
jgi:nucleotide-binding universal stress UspA family protein